MEAINSRIQLNPMITVSLMQMIGSETRLDVLAAAIPAPWKRKKKWSEKLF